MSDYAALWNVLRECEEHFSAKNVRRSNVLESGTRRMQATFEENQLLDTFVSHLAIYWSIQDKERENENSARTKAEGKNNKLFD